ncbi:NAD(P)-binding protein [Thozetella sp. PMI_491]|nr:NAD(P)-binding protein [Thozetella sp. PMI_491]
MAPTYDNNTKGSQLVKELAGNIQGKVILITGPAQGSIGEAYCKAVAKAAPALLILASRNVEGLGKTAQAVQEIAPEVKIKLVGIDLSSFKSVRKAADEINSWADVPYIDVALNNAGIMAVPYAKTEDGFERQFATNHLGHFLLTNLIMDKILASATPRVVNITSNGHRYSPIRWWDYGFEDGKLYNRWSAYGQAKTANCLFSISLAAKLGGRGLQAFTVHPGVFFSNLGKDLDWAGDAMTTMIQTGQAIGTEPPQRLEMTDEDGIIATHIFTSFSDDIRGHNGGYFLSCQLADPYKNEIQSWARDPIEADKLWILSEKLVGQQFRY